MKKKIIDYSKTPYRNEAHRLAHIKQFIWYAASQYNGGQGSKRTIDNVIIDSSGVYIIDSNGVYLRAT